MGTRSLTIVEDEDGKECLVMYRQMDGYPAGHGAGLVEGFGNTKICNGIPVGRDNSNYANGMSCLAAQVVAYFKKGIGGIYLYPSGSRGMDEEYIYVLYPKNNFDGDEKILCLKVISVGWKEPDTILFDGAISAACQSEIFK